MYRLDFDQKGGPFITWQEPYQAGDRVKPGQVDIGTGTTPTLLGNEYVAISDNADPLMHVVVWRRAKNVHGPRLVCEVEVFGSYGGQTSNENSLIGTDESIIVENNYGYTGPSSVAGGATTLRPARPSTGSWRAQGPALTERIPHWRRCRAKAATAACRSSVGRRAKWGAEKRGSHGTGTWHRRRILQTTRAGDARRLVS